MFKDKIFQNVDDIKSLAEHLQDLWEIFAKYANVNNYFGIFVTHLFLYLQVSDGIYGEWVTF